MPGDIIKLAIIAGGGDLPLALVDAAEQAQFEHILIALDGFYDRADVQAPYASHRLGDVGKILKTLKNATVDTVCFAGYVTRPDFKRLRPDAAGLRYLPGAIAAAAKGDDALLRYAGKIFENKGMRLIAPQDIARHLLISSGPLGQVELTDDLQADVSKALDIARIIGAQDIGQGAVICGGLTLAVEAQEGTDVMLARVASLPERLRGTPSDRKGVLAKIVKPGQDRRMDLPTIGPETVRGAAEAGLAAIVMVADEGFVMQRAETIALADKYGSLWRALSRTVASAHIYIVAAETSGDAGAGLIREIKRLDPHIKLSGIGGQQMATHGIESLFDISPLAILGILEGLKSYGTVMRLVRAAVDDVINKAPDAVVLIDSWGFMIRVAEGLKKRGFNGRIIKYVAPQVWAMREGRTKVLARSVDHLLTLHSFEAPYFEREGLPVTYVGNAVFETDYRSGDGAVLRAELGIGERPVLAVLFGSRPSEIARLTEPFAQTIKRLLDAYPELVIISPLAQATEKQLREHPAMTALGGRMTLLPETRKLDVFAAADMALACSGTVTTQLACAGVPAAVGYKLGGLSYRLAKLMFKADYISIVNLAAGEMLLPEFLQDDCAPDNLAHILRGWIDDPAAREALSERLIAQTEKMKAGGNSASLNAAKAVMSLIA